MEELSLSIFKSNIILISTDPRWVVENNRRRFFIKEEAPFHFSNISNNHKTAGEEDRIDRIDRMKRRKKD
jgi:hypothetical protein